MEFFYQSIAPLFHSYFLTNYLMIIADLRVTNLASFRVL